MLTEQDRLAAKEFEEYYSSFDPDTDRLLGLLQEHFPEDERSRFSYETKAEFYELLARECRIHLFRRSGFFFEISSGRERFTWGGLQSPVGSFFHECTASLWLNIYGEETAPDREQGYLYNWNNPVGFDHHCPGYDLILSSGIRGMIRQAQAALSACCEERKRSFYRSVIRADGALLLLAERFSEEAHLPGKPRIRRNRLTSCASQRRPPAFRRNRPAPSMKDCAPWSSAARSSALWTASASAPSVTWTGCCTRCTVPIWRQGA